MGGHNQHIESYENPAKFLIFTPRILIYLNTIHLKNQMSPMGGHHQHHI
jgi:hypothetical protein